MPAKDRPEDRPTRGLDVADGDPQPLSRRSVGLLMALWTVLMAVWFMVSTADGALRTSTVVLAVGGLIGIVWLLGLLMLALFLVAGE